MVEDRRVHTLGTRHYVYLIIHFWHFWHAFRPKCPTNPRLSKPPAHYLKDTQLTVKEQYGYLTILDSELVGITCFKVSQLDKVDDERLLYLLVYAREITRHGNFLSSFLAYKNNVKNL